LVSDSQEGGDAPPRERIAGGKRRARRRRGANRAVADGRSGGGAALALLAPATQSANPAGKARRHRRRKRRASVAAGQPPRPAATPQTGSPAVFPARMSAGNGVEPSVRPAANGGVFAALDLGTNNCRLLIAVPAGPERLRVVGAFSRIVRLGEGLGASGSLSSAAMERALGALKICAERMARHTIGRQRLIATEACRRADNGAEFLARVTSETGLVLEIVDRRTEALLAAEGCGSLIDRKARSAVLFDIGGGSTELVLIDRRNGGAGLETQIAAWTSLPVGVVTLSERHGGASVTAQAYEAMVAEAIGHIGEFAGRREFAAVWRAGDGHLLGTSGTVTTIAGIHLGLARYDRRAVDGAWLTDDETSAVVSRLRDMDFEARAANACIGRERADLVLAGCAVLDAIRRTWPSERLRVADRGLREGMLLRMMREEGAFGRDRRLRAREARP
jgi:exopolyphosphatase/guanosine-5'-triphosphate,3'-diphosphate pyrophosphatase